MKKHLSTIILVLILFLGVAILLYPSVSDYYNSFHQSRVIAGYIADIDSLEQEDYTMAWAAAEGYNDDLRTRPNRFLLSEEDYAEYEGLLNPTGRGIMGYIEVPAIGCSLPIYHGTDEAVLQIAIGHIEGSSLPTGGLGTHTVLSGHRGLPSAKLFTDLDQLVEGDLFVIRVLDRVMTYEVDQILIVLPEELSALAIDPEMDYCTLITCTPYGVNTHRLLVRGHRTENAELERNILVVTDATQVRPLLVAPVIAAPILLLMLVWLLVTTGKKSRRHRQVMATATAEEIFRSVEAGGAKDAAPAKAAPRRKARGRRAR